MDSGTDSDSSCSCVLYETSKGELFLSNTLSSEEEPDMLAPDVKGPRLSLDARDVIIDARWQSLHTFGTGKLRKRKLHGAMKHMYGPDCSPMAAILTSRHLYIVSSKLLILSCISLEMNELVTSMAWLGPSLVFASHAPFGRVRYCTCAGRTGEVCTLPMKNAVYDIVSLFPDRIVLSCAGANGEQPLTVVTRPIVPMEALISGVLDAHATSTAQENRLEDGVVHFDSKNRSTIYSATPCRWGGWLD